MTYVGTPARSTDERACVMPGSSFVQSAFMVTKLPLRNAASTSAVLRAIRSFTWQLRHHAAVKSINTGRPAACAAFTACSEYGCHARSRFTLEAAPALPDDVAAAVFAALLAASAAILLCCERGRVSPSAISTTAAIALPHLAGQRLSVHPAIAASRKQPSSSASWVTPPCPPERACSICPHTHASQIAVAKKITAVACLKSSIHAPGLGSSFAQAGCQLSRR